MTDIKYPIKLIAIAGLVSVVVLFVVTWVSHQGYHTLLETGADEARMQRLRSKIWNSGVPVAVSEPAPTPSSEGNRQS